MWKPRLAALVLPLFAAGGCFYFDEINQRPSVQIRQLDDKPVHRTEQFSLVAETADPESDVVGLTWRAYACTDAFDFATCDADFQTSLTSAFLVTAPRIITLAGVDVPTQAMLIKLEAKDAKGATARPVAELIVPVLDSLPTIELRSASRYESAEDTPIELFALVGDFDDLPEELEVTWTPTGYPVGSSYELVDANPATAPVPDEPTLLQHAMVFTPHDPGTYSFKVRAFNSQNPGVCADEELCTETIDITVGEDRAPCILQTTPAASPTGALVPLTEPTLFRVPFVSDDLDGFPSIPDDTIAGAPTFAWSVKAPGQPSYVAQAGVVGNSIAFDPAAYSLGDVMDVRVEVKDRKLTPVNCPAGDLFCSTISSPTCVQRVTWRVEVR